MVKNSSGAAEVEERREVGEVGEVVAVVVAVEVSERREVVVGSRWLWRWRRFDNINKKD